MKLVLCSEGFHTSNTVKTCADLVGKPTKEISIAIINEAFATQTGDKRWVLHNLNCAADNFGGEIDIIDLLALPLSEVEQRIRAKDVLFVVGGDPGYLMDVFVRTGFNKILPSLLKDKVYVGSSAGSMVLGKRLPEGFYAQLYGDERDFGTNDYMELVNFSIIAHLDSDEFPRRTEKVMLALPPHKGLTYALRDDSAYIVDGDNSYTIGSEPVKLINGKRV